ncbi:heme ABC transporter ATP-binding protein [Spongorhabdus nitratireducens]
MMDQKACLEVAGLTVERGGRLLLQDISLSVAPGEMVAVLGPNGAGKSTLFRSITGEMAFQQGLVSLGQQAIDSWSPLDKAHLLGVLPQSSTLNFSFSVEEVVLLGRTPHATSNAENLEIVTAALKKVDALHLLERNYTALSGGEKQRVHLARVLAQVWEPSARGSRVLLLDEPTSALDPAHQHLTLQVAREFATADTGCMVILHDFNLAARYADRVLVIQNGQLVASGTPDEVMTPDVIHRVFELDVVVMKHPQHGCPLVIT